MELPGRDRARIAGGFMTRSIMWRVLGLAVSLVVAAAAAAPAQDNEAILKERQATMKLQGKDLGNIKAYLDGKADQAAAVAASTSLTETTRKIPSPNAL